MSSRRELGANLASFRQLYSDTWEYRDGDWLQRFPQIRPTPGAVIGSFDPVRGRVVVRSLF